MIVKWKTYRKTFPYICGICGEFSNRQFCEKCGDWDRVRKITREDYEHYIKKNKTERPKLEENTNKTKISRSTKKKKTIRMILIIFGAFIIIDFIGFLIILNILGIPFNEIGDHLPIFFMLLGLSLIMFFLIVITIYLTYYGGRYFWWLH